MGECFQHPEVHFPFSHELNVLRSGHEDSAKPWPSGLIGERRVVALCVMGTVGSLEAAAQASTMTGLGMCAAAELAQKARKEIADYLAAGKDERARIRVEHIIREDYLVEAMEILELYCDLLLARFGLIQSMK